MRICVSVHWRLFSPPVPLLASCVIPLRHQEDKNIHHARKALLLGCVALGAVFCGDAASAGAYMARAQIHLKDCFDALLPEVGRRKTFDIHFTLFLPS